MKPPADYGPECQGSKLLLGQFDFKASKIQEEEFMKWSIGKKIGAGYVLALVFILFIGIISYRSIAALIATAGRVSHTHRILSEVDDVASAMKDAEIGARGFVITGDEHFLEA